MFAFLAALAGLGVIGVSLLASGNTPPSYQRAPSGSPVLRQPYTSRFVRNEAFSMPDLNLRAIGDQIFEGESFGRTFQIDFSEMTTSLRVMALPENLVVRRTSLSSHTRIDFQTGDPSFDNHWQIQGDSARLAIILDPANRSRIADLPGLAIENGVLLMTTSSHHLRADIKEAIRLAQAFDIPEQDLGPWLYRKLWTEENSNTRLGLLKALLNLGGPLAEQATKRTLLDADVRIRFTAAAAGGEKSLRQLIDLLISPDLPETDILAGLDTLVETRQVAALQEVLPKLRLSPRRSLKLAALKATPHGREADAVALLTMEANSRDSHIAEAAAFALADLGAEDVLLELLRGEAPIAQVAATRALARMGSAKGAERLAPMTIGAHRPSEVKTAAQDALQRIRERLAQHEASLAVARAESKQRLETNSDETLGKAIAFVSRPSPPDIQPNPEGQLVSFDAALRLRPKRS